MVFFPHRTKGEPKAFQQAMNYIMECMNQKDYLAAMFYSYWGVELLLDAKVKKKERAKRDEAVQNLLNRVPKLKELYEQKPVASTMTDEEMKVMRRRLETIYDEFIQAEKLIPKTMEEAQAIAERFKNLTEEAAFLDEQFSPTGQIEGPLVWQDRLSKLVEILFSRVGQ